MSNTTPKKQRKKQPSVLRKLRAKTQGASAHLTREDDWDTEVPNVRLSRVFAIVLILHVVAVGGILAFQLLNPDSAASEVAAALPEAAPGKSLDTGRIMPAGGLQQLRGLDDPALDGLKPYRVQSGDSLMGIARSFGVSTGELERVNDLDGRGKFHVGAILYIPNRVVAAETPGELQVLKNDRLPQIIEPNNKRETAGTRVPLALNDRKMKDVRRPASIGNVARTSQEGLSRREARPGAVEKKRASGSGVVGRIKAYTVVEGDTLYGIGRKFGVSADKLLELNGIANPRSMRAGQKLKVPVKN